MKIREIQKYLKESGIDGWLLFDFHGSNKFARSLLQVPEEALITRRFFYWIPSEGVAEKIVHVIEADSLDFLPGNKRLYLSWVELERCLEEVLRGAKRVAMEYSPKSAIPAISVVDGGTIDLIRSKGVEVVSSAELLLRFTTVLSEEQIELHKAASVCLKNTFERVWELIVSRVTAEKRITDYEVQQFILSEFAAANCITEDWPICAVNEHTAEPHYFPSKTREVAIQKGDYLLVDMWCKKDHPKAIYADLTRVAVLASEPSPRQQEIFEVVKGAQEAALELIQSRFSQNQPLTGAEVDTTARNYIEKKGYGPCFTHRTGHSIDTQVHGSGANLDNFETADDRQLLPGTCFALEPAIYLPNEMGVRIECDIILTPEGKVELTGGSQEIILCLL